MKNLNPNTQDLIIKSIGYAFAIIVAIAVLKIASRLFLGMIPLALIIFVVLKIQDNKNFK